MYFNFNFISAEVAKAINKVLETNGEPSMDRILVLSPKEKDIVQGGIIIPGSAKEDKPNKGVVVQTGYISDEYAPYKPVTTVGRVITYGMYAGKEVDFDPQIFKDAGISINFEGSHFTVLAINEIIYSETNKN